MTDKAMSAERARILKLELMDHLERIPGADWTEITEIIGDHLRDAVAQSRAEIFEQTKKMCVEELKELKESRRKCPDENDHHDDRWCSECESMKNAYGYAEEQIRTLPLSALDEKTDGKA